MICPKCEGYHFDVELGEAGELAPCRECKGAGQVPDKDEAEKS